MKTEKIDSLIEALLKPQPGQLQPSDIRILVVDDDDESITPLRLCLQNNGCTFKIVSNGFEAVKELVSSDDQYDLIILDWIMPEMTGAETLISAQRALSVDPSIMREWKQRRLPVVTFSSLEKEELALPECKNFKVVDHWEKPAPYLQLLDRVKEILSVLKTETPRYS